MNRHMAALRAHRHEEAERGFPLLWGCPSTFVLRRLTRLDALSEAERLGYADELSELAEAQASTPLSQADREALLLRLPLVARIEGALPTRPDLRFQTVKTLARLAAEPGGIEGFIRLHDLPLEAARPPAPHVGSFEAAIPVPPGQLRKAVLTALEARFGGKAQKISAEQEQLVAPLPRGRMVLNLGFAGKGAGAMSRQLDYSLWADLDGRRMTPTSYEAIWLLPAQWDLLTPTNLAAAVQHLLRVIEARLTLEE
jgi:hypothetical protein